jgi:hypothetical protein
LTQLPYFIVFSLFQFKQPKSPSLKDTGGETDKPSSEVAIGKLYKVLATGSLGREIHSCIEFLELAFCHGN